MALSLLPAPALAEPKEGTCHLSSPAGLSVHLQGSVFVQVDWNFGADANAFLAFFLQYVGHPIQGVPDQIAATFCIKTKVLLLLHLPFTQERTD